MELNKAYQKAENDYPGDLIIYFPDVLLNQNSNKKVLSIGIDLIVPGSNEVNY